MFGCQIHSSGPILGVVPDSDFLCEEASGGVVLT